jgi:hypothetical protein
MSGYTAGEVSSLGPMTEDDTDRIVAEITELRREISELKTRTWESRPPHRWFQVVWRDLEVDPYLQYQVHRWGSYWWLFNFLACSALFFFGPVIWLKWGLYITLMYSIYANLATDYGSMSAAMAAFGRPPLPPIPASPVIAIMTPPEKAAEGGESPATPADS